MKCGQALNFFALGAEPTIQAFLVDMPGYGYAVADRASREQWGKLSADYLRTRKRLIAVVLVIDIRRSLGPLDDILLGMMHADQQLLLLASKADKLNRQQQHNAVHALKQVLALSRNMERTQVVGFSAATGIGMDNARAIIEQWI